MQFRIPAVLIPLALGACAGPGTPVPVQGDAQVLAGEWSGTYASDETGRSGSILFHLVAGTDTATGDVLMIPNWPGPYSISQYVPPEDYARPPEALRIQMVRVFGHQVAGQLSRYEDPDCGCLVTTIFSGRLDGNTLEGVYHTYHADGITFTGKWRVARKVSHAQPER